MYSYGIAFAEYERYLAKIHRPDFRNRVRTLASDDRSLQFRPVFAEKPAQA